MGQAYLSKTKKRHLIQLNKLISRKLLVATHNTGKLEEIYALLKSYDISLSSAADHGLKEPKETENTFVGNAKLKAHYAANETGLPALSDDSGLEIDALNNLPGVYTADWAETDHGRDFDIAMQKVNTALNAIEAPLPRTARFCCTLVLAFPNGNDIVFSGVLGGEIIWPQRGKNGHGYDPIFQPDGFSLTFGEMDRWEKNKISHRGLAFKKFISYLDG